jgi:hypothetical protein
VKDFVLVAFVTVTMLSELEVGRTGLHLPLVLGETLPELGLVGEYREILGLVRSTEELATTVVTREENSEPAEQLFPLA